jgi:hypothetical protein
LQLFASDLRRYFYCLNAKTPNFHVSSFSLMGLQQQLGFPVVPFLWIHPQARLSPGRFGEQNEWNGRFQQMPRWG